MAYRTKESVLSHVQFIQREELDSAAGLPFRQLLSAERIAAALARAGVRFRDRVFTPCVTLWAFLSQVVARKDGSCRDAVSRVLADRVVQGRKACSPDTSSYCQARGRLREQVLADLTRETGQELHRQSPAAWRWKGRQVVLVDGSTASMADTAENQRAYPQSRNQQPGLGFPLLRFVVLLSLAVGTVLECAVGPCRGKKTGEQALFRRIWDVLQPGDIVLGDRLYDAFRDIAALQARGVDVIFGRMPTRSCDFRRGRKLGPDDHVVAWRRPGCDASRFENRAEWEALPAELLMREIRLTVRRKGYRTRVVAVVTTLLDGGTYSAQDVTDLFAERWHCELDLRSIKQALGMHHLSSKTPAMVRKELWTHLLAYNLIRVRMAQAAAVHGCVPRRLSFTAAKILIHNFALHSRILHGQQHRRLEAALLLAIARCEVPNRPGRKEPRAVKKRVQKYPYLTKPRALARKHLAA